MYVLVRGDIFKRCMWCQGTGVVVFPGDGGKSCACQKFFIEVSWACFHTSIIPRLEDGSRRIMSLRSS
jgi:hypothetical protein